MDELPFPEGARVVAYLRDSGGREQDQSTLQQREAIGRWCVEHGLILSRVFEDAARSGTKIAGRDNFIGMMDYFSNHPREKGVIFWELSRFSRDYNDCQYYLSDLRRQGFTVHSLTDNIPPGLDGQMLESMKIWMNAKYIEDLKKNIKRGLRYITDVHHAKLGVIPVGYHGEPKQIGTRRDGSPHIINVLVPDPDTAPLVHKAFEMRSQGATFMEIDAQLHLFKTIWAYSKMLKNLRYLGEYQGIENYCEPIVDKQLFDEVQLVNKQHASHFGINHPRVSRSRFYLSGLIYCNRCGKRMYANSTQHTGKPRYDYYICTSGSTVSCGSKRIPKLEIENLILEKFRYMLMRPDTLRDLYDAIPKQQSNLNVEKEANKDRITAQIRVVKGQITNILKAIKDTGHSRSMLADLQSLEGRQLELEGQIVSLEMKPAKTKQPKFDDLITQVEPYLKDLTDKEKGVILRSFIDSIQVEKKDGILIGAIGWIFRVDDNEENIVIPLPL